MISKDIFFLISVFAFSLIKENYANEVILKDGPYKFDLTLTFGMTMSTQDTINDIFSPVIYNTQENAFYKRDADLDQACNKMDKVTDQNELDTIVTASGYHRHLVLINGKFPGPPIVVPKDAYVEITVHNHLYSDAVNIHWHGQEQRGTFFMDGVPGITECPINPGSSYTYKFKASTVGTHWYHAHIGVQRTEGVYGAFIVKDLEENVLEQKDIKLVKYNKTVWIEVPELSTNKSNIPENSMIEIKQTKAKYDKEFYILLQDWVKGDSESVYTQIHWRNFKFFPGYANTTTCFWHNRMIDGTLLPPIPFDTILINGKGWGENIPTNLIYLNKNLLKLPLDVFTVEPNKKYLFRVISASNGHPFEVSVSGHKLTLVASDGKSIKPIDDLDSFIVHSGERYDFEINTKSDAESDNFFIIAKTLDKIKYDYSRFEEEHFGLAILNYKNVNRYEIKNNHVRQCSPIEPCRIANCFHVYPSVDRECISLDKLESNMIPDEDKKILKQSYNSDEFEEYFLNFHFSGTKVHRASVNNYQFNSPILPPYFAQDYTTNIKKCPNCSLDGLCQCTKTLNLKKNKVVQMTILSMGVGAHQNNTAHPIHLHGHHFYVVKVGFPSYDSNGLIKSNNRDINCIEFVDACNNVTWSNSSWLNGNLPAMSSNPIKKDTVFIPAGGYIVLRFYTDNPGYWFMHCHVENHMVEGMSLLIQSGTNEEIRSLVDWDSINTCGKGFNKPLNNANKFNLKINFLYSLCLIALFKILRD